MTDAEMVIFLCDVRTSMYHTDSPKAKQIADFVDDSILEILKRIGVIRQCYWQDGVGLGAFFDFGFDPNQSEKYKHKKWSKICDVAYPYSIIPTPPRID